MNLSNRIIDLTGGGSDGWDVHRRAREMIGRGIPVIDLTIGEHDEGTLQAILDEMHRSACSGHTGYAAVPGTPSLRDEIAARVTKRTGIPTSRENVVVTPGGQAAWFAAHAAVCDPGDTALFVDPYYATYPGTIRGVGAVPRVVRAQPGNAFRPRPADIAPMADGASSLLINSPNNPTGIVYDRDTLSGIADICRKRDLWLISDEVYDTQVWQGEHCSPRTLPGMSDRTLVIGSMSKGHAMTGSRVGWIIGPEPAIEHLINLSTHTTYGVAGFIQDAAQFALRKGTQLEEIVAAPFQRRHAAAMQLLRESNSVRAVPSGGAMYIMLDIRSTGMTGSEFAEQLLDARRIAVMPGESFGEAAAGHLRIALTTRDDLLLEALSSIEKFAAHVSSETESASKSGKQSLKHDAI